MLVLCANTKEHLEALAGEWILAEIFPWTDVSSGKWCDVHCSCCQGYLNRLQAGVGIALAPERICPDSMRPPGHQPTRAPVTLTQALGHPHPLPLRPGASPSLSRFQNGIGGTKYTLTLGSFVFCSINPQQGTGCEDCKCKSDLSKWQHLVS